MQAGRPINVTSFGAFELRLAVCDVDGTWTHDGHGEWVHASSVSDAGRKASALGELHNFGPYAGRPNTLWGTWAKLMLEAFPAPDAEAATPGFVALVGADLEHRVQIRRAEDAIAATTTAAAAAAAAAAATATAATATATATATAPAFDSPAPAPPAAPAAAAAPLPPDHAATPGEMRKRPTTATPLDGPPPTKKGTQANTGLKARPPNESVRPMSPTAAPVAGGTRPASQMMPAAKKPKPAAAAPAPAPAAAPQAAVQATAQARGPAAAPCSRPVQPVQSVQWAPAWSKLPTAATPTPDETGVEMNQLRTQILKHTVNGRVKWARSCRC